MLLRITGRPCTGVGTEPAAASEVDDGGAGPSHPWERSPVAAEHQIRGLGPITLSVPELAPTAMVLTQVMNMRESRGYALPGGTPVHVYEMGDGGPAAELHVAVEPDAAPAQPGAGGVHHVAFRTPDAEEYAAWAERLRRLRGRKNAYLARRMKDLTDEEVETLERAAEILERMREGERS